jgi:hypothetical protein
MKIHPRDSQEKVAYPFSGVMAALRAGVHNITSGTGAATSKAYKAHNLVKAERKALIRQAKAQAKWREAQLNAGIDPKKVTPAGNLGGSSGVLGEGAETAAGGPKTDLGKYIGAHPIQAAVGAGGVGFLASRAVGNRQQNQGFQPTVYKVGMDETAFEEAVLEKAALAPLAKALMALGIGGGVGAGVSHGMTRSHWEPVTVGVANPQTGEYAGDVIGPGAAVRDWQSAMEKAKNYEDLNRAMAEADARSVVFRGKTASVREDDRTPGQLMAHTFLSTLSKIAAAHAERLYEEGHLTEETTDQFRQGVYSLPKLARLLIADASLNVDR